MEVCAREDVFPGLARLLLCRAVLCDAADGGSVDCIPSLCPLFLSVPVATGGLNTPLYLKGLWRNE
jgi:hypothetical protein